jgi:hypothetical protein
MPSRTRSSGRLELATTLNVFRNPCLYVSEQKTAPHEALFFVTYTTGVDGGGVGVVSPIGALLLIFDQTNQPIMSAKTTPTPIMT